jgi:cell pole-organizing protein PopZ
MGDVSAEPSMEDILSSIKRIIAEDGDNAAPRARRASRAASTVAARPVQVDDGDEVLELSELAPEPEPAPPPVAAGEPLLSADVAQASRGSLEALTRMIAQPEAAAPAPPAGGQTMDAFVAELLRPLLREWLDTHLPDMVEAMVAKEIARITGNR